MHYNPSGREIMNKVLLRRVNVLFHVQKRHIYSLQFLLLILWIRSNAVIWCVQFLKCWNHAKQTQVRLKKRGTKMCPVFFFWFSLKYQTILSFMTTHGVKYLLFHLSFFSLDNLCMMYISKNFMNFRRNVSDS